MRDIKHIDISKKNPPFAEAKIILLETSITMTNKKENKGSPCLKPHKKLKIPMAELFTKIENTPKKQNKLSNPISP
jgi:hypothetical protein